MHEFSIATDIVENVREFAETRGVKILRVRIEVGELSCVDPEQLCFCYHSITTGTALENSELEIKTAAALVNCSHCGYEGPPNYWSDALASASVPTLQCPACGKTAAAIKGNDCCIKSVQFAPSSHPTETQPVTSAA
jgi:hydrogenase nickel incorporation protein HypA/HybF